MYNFRYHLVTIVSIFAALALGLLLGVAITGSKLVQDASTNLAESLTEQFDELNNANEALTEQLKTEQSFSDGLLASWQKNRLEGRTILILTRASEVSDSLTDELSTLISESGGVPLVVRIDPSRGFGLDDEALLNSLKQLLPELEEEDYEVTLARALTDEWTTAVPTDEAFVQATFEARYPLTTLLVSRQRIAVTTGYQPLIDAFGTILPEAEAQTPSVGTDEESVEGTEEPSEATRLARQRLAYELAEQTQLPYNISGVIDAATFTDSTEEQVSADPVALQIALAFERKGMAGSLPYSHLSVAAGAETDSSNASYYALLTQQGQPVEAEAMLAASRDTGLPCELSPLDPMGRYGIIALLSGAEKGRYGLQQDGITPFPPVPTS
jgi:hypothetical protein